MLAFLALAFQLVFSFGHIHPEDIFPEAAPAEAQDAPGAPAPDPAKHGPATPDVDCAICIAMGLVAASALPPPILPATPVLVVRAVYALPAPAPARVISRRLYRSRDPPLA